MSLAPIVVFTYNRPSHTEKMLESLLANPEASNSDIFIYSDGLKVGHDPEPLAQTRTLLHRMAPANALIIERDTNLGLAPSIIDGVTAAVEKYGKVIIIEDDLLLSPTTLAYLNRALEHYKDDEKVMHISAYMFPVKAKLPELFFYREATCWGWATWDRAWKKFNPNAQELLDAVKSSNRLHEFDVRGTMYFSPMLQRQIEGKVNSWAIRWYASIFLANGLSLHPGKSFVQNIGFDGTGVHCAPTKQYEVKVVDQSIRKFPSNLVESDEAVSAMIKYRQPNRENFRPLVKRLTKQILRTYLPMRVQKFVFALRNKT